MTSIARIFVAVLIGACSSNAPAVAGEVPAGTTQPAAPLPSIVVAAEAESELAPHGEGNVYAPDVLFDGGRYRMWYGGQGKDGHDRIHYAESADGRAWRKSGVVLDDAKANHVNDPSVVKVGGTFYMYYTRTARDVVDRIDVAVSRDGKAWEPKGAALARGDAGAWDDLSVGRPSVIYEDGVFSMWYDGRRDFPPGAPVNNVPTSPTSHRSVGYATSTDGLRWTRHGTRPVFGHDAGGVDVTRVGDRLVMAYESRDGTRAAASADGVAWADHGLLAERSGTATDAFGHVTPCLLAGGGGGGGVAGTRLYVGAARASTWDRNRIAVIDVAARLGQVVAASGGWANPIVKRGYLGSPLVETTPFVFNDKLYRIESWQKYWELPGLPPPNTRSEEDAVRVFDVAARKVIATPLLNHGFATALVWDGRVYVFAAQWDRPRRKAGTISMTSSTDLVNWTEPVTVLKGEGAENLYNVAVCRGRDGFVLLYETDDAAYVPFTFKYCASPDLTKWTRIPSAFYGRDKYVGGPALYFEGDTYYTLYLEDLGGRWETRVARSKDLVQWEDTPAGRPFVTFDAAKDRVPLRPPGVKEINASDVELCEWPRGKTFLYFTGSDQQYAGDLQWAEFDGTPRALLEHFFR